MPDEPTTPRSAGPDAQLSTPPGTPPGAAPPLWLATLLVAVGAVAGAAIRAGLTAAFGQTHTVAGLWTILAINLTGAFALGALTEATSGAARLARLTRLALGTGVLGGFTTYSTFAVDVATGSSAGPPTDVAAYLAATLLVGPLAALLGISAWASVATFVQARSEKGPA